MRSCADTLSQLRIVAESHSGWATHSLRKQETQRAEVMQRRNGRRNKEGWEGRQRGFPSEVHDLGAHDTLRTKSARQFRRASAKALGGGLGDSGRRNPAPTKSDTLLRGQAAGTRKYRPVASLRPLRSSGEKPAKEESTTMKLWDLTSTTAVIVACRMSPVFRTLWIFPRISVVPAAHFADPGDYRCRIRRR